MHEPERVECVWLISPIQVARRHTEGAVKIPCDWQLRSQQTRNVGGDQTAALTFEMMLVSMKASRQKNTHTVESPCLFSVFLS